MHPPVAPHSLPLGPRFARAMLGLALCCAGGVALAQNHEGLKLGVAAGSTDYGTGLKAQLSQGFKMPLAALGGAWRWEAQAASYGSENYLQFGNTYQRRAWAVGGSLLPQLPLASSLTGYGKLGVHYLHSEASGPGLSSTKSNLKLGVGAGLTWQMLPRLGLKLEVENIGGSGGDIVTVGAEIPL